MLTRLITNLAGSPPRKHAVHGAHDQVREIADRLAHIHDYLNGVTESLDGEPAEETAPERRTAA